MEEIAEVFAFLRNERSDVRKMAAQGLAALSKDNGDVVHYVRQNSDAACRTIVGLLRMEEAPLLGDAFAALVNIATDANAADALVTAGAIDRVLNVLAAMDRLANAPKPAASPASPAVAAAASVVSNPSVAAAVRELALMALNNLTSASHAAVAALLQLDDEDMQGFYLDRLAPGFAALLAADASAASAAAEGGDAAEAKPDAPNPRLVRWLLRIALNCCRVMLGAVTVLENDAFAEALMKAASNDAEAAIAALQGCASHKRCHVRMGELGVPFVLVSALERGSAHSDTVVDALMQLMSSAPGMEALESINTKSQLTALLPKAADGVRARIEKDLLPFLDDVQDVHVIERDD